MPYWPRSDESLRRQHDTLAPMQYEYSSEHHNPYTAQPVSSDHYPAQIEEVEMRDASPPPPQEFTSTAINNNMEEHESTSNPPPASKPSKESKHSSVVGLWKQYSLMLMEIPSLLHEWAHLLYNLFLLCVVAAIIATVIVTLYGDYSIKYRDLQRQMVQQNIQCQQHFMDNKCLPETRVPALQEKCQEWEHCMWREGDSVAGAKITATVLAEILDSFVQTLSYKTMAFLAAMVLLISSLRWLVGNVYSDARRCGQTYDDRSSSVAAERRYSTLSANKSLPSQQYMSSQMPMRRYYSGRGEFGRSGFANVKAFRRSRSLTPARLHFREPSYCDGNGDSAEELDYVSDSSDHLILGE